MSERHPVSALDEASKASSGHLDLPAKLPAPPAWTCRRSVNTTKPGSEEDKTKQELIRRLQATGMTETTPMGVPPKRPLGQRGIDGREALEYNGFFWVKAEKE